jgi:hypothetical protein
LLGKIDIEPTRVEIYYGTNEYPIETMTGVSITKQDREVTDRQKAEFFTKKKGQFYVLDETIANNVKQYFSDELSDFIRELNAR